MFYRRKGKPQEDDIVLCKVTKIYPNSVFASLLEFHNTSGMIHISEVSPGRIRNLRDYVSEGRQIICKILRIDEAKGHIDLSLRRVNSTARREKLDEIKQEVKAEQLIKNVAKKLEITPLELYKKISTSVFKEYAYVHQCFKDIVDGHADLQKMGISKKIADEISAAVIDKFKPKKITIKGEIRIKTYDTNGVEKIKETLQAIEKISTTLTLFYLGAGRYKLLIEDFEYKPAEATLAKAQKILDKFVDKQSTVEFIREKNE